MEFVVTISLIGEQYYYMANSSSTKKLAEATKFPTIGEAMVIRASSTCDVFSGDNTRETGIDRHPENSDNEAQASDFTVARDAEPLSGKRCAKYGAGESGCNKAEAVYGAGNNGLMLS